MIVEDTFQDFREKLNAALLQTEISDEEAARLFDVSLPSVSRWKAGETQPHPTLQRMVLGLLEGVASSGQGLDSLQR